MVDFSGVERFGRTKVCIPWGSHFFVKKLHQFHLQTQNNFFMQIKRNFSGLQSGPVTSLA